MEKADNEQKQESLLLALSDFKCSQDLDIETFLHTKAEEYLKRKWCSIYLILNEELFLEGKLKIEAYFTLSHKILGVNEDISKTRVKEIDGFKKTVKSLHFVLIGQLGKFVSDNGDGTYTRSEITSKEILDYAFEVIYASSELIPCRCVLVECSDEEKIKKVYEDYEFKFFQNDGTHNQYYKVLE
ncbi:MAG: hypothetical protein J6B23_06275 [Clostridia bacterium]|nr:hypothetical protein [Clostridia bacterium]